MGVQQQACLPLEWPYQGGPVLTDTSPQQTHSLPTVLVPSLHLSGAAVPFPVKQDGIKSFA